MTTGYRSTLSTRRDGFAQLLRAEWTKLRSVRGWVIGLTVMVVTIVGLGLFTASNSFSSCTISGKESPCPTPPRGPDGEAVDDKFYFVNQKLTGDGEITVRITDLTGTITYPPPDHDKIVPGTVPWAKAGVMVKQSLKQGSAYAAVMATADHGVRMQHNYTHDIAGDPGRPGDTAPRWLRLVRSGDTITGYEAIKPEKWSKVGTIVLAELPETVRIGMFVASPGSITVTQGEFGGSNEQLRLAKVRAEFDNVSAPDEDWHGDDLGLTLGPDGRPHHPGSVRESDGVFTIGGNGDVAPSTDGHTPEGTLMGVWIGLIAVVVVAALFATTEYRRRVIRTTLLASPRRGRVLAAKAIVIGTCVFVLGLLATAITLPLGKSILRGNGNYVLPVPVLTEVRIVVGVAALLGLTAVLSVAVGALFRRGLTAALSVSTVMILPLVLSATSMLPQSIPQWLLRVTPAAGFAIQQSIPEYPQVLGNYSPVAGYYPLPPWAGLAVLAAFAAGTLWLAADRLSRRDA